LILLQITRGRTGSGSRTLCCFVYFGTAVKVAERLAVGYIVALAHTPQNVRGIDHLDRSGTLGRKNVNVGVTVGLPGIA
jgi:hypothetical protein